MAADFFIPMRWSLKDIESARKRARDKIVPVAGALADELNIGKNDDLFIVGGFVRDNVLAELTNQKPDSKDLDIILPKRPSFENNPNILWKKENSFGGIKIGTKNFQEIDVFQPNATDVELIVGQFFDFNCNALYYSHWHKDIYLAAPFYGFTSCKEINLENYIYYNDQIEHRYSRATMISRALKFQIMFREKFGFETKLSSTILYMLYEMEKDEEQEMFDYTKVKVKSIEIQNRIFNEYKNLKHK